MIHRLVCLAFAACALLLPSVAADDLIEVPDRHLPETEIVEGPASEVFHDGKICPPANVQNWTNLDCMGNAICKMPGIYGNQGPIVFGQGSRYGALVRTAEISSGDWLYLGIIVSPFFGC